MQSRTDQRGFPPVLARGFAPVERTGLLIGGLTLLVFVIADVLLGRSAPITGTYGSTGYYVRLGAMVIAAAFAVAGAWALHRSRANTRGLELLDAIGDIADGSLPLAETLRRVTEVIVPAAADICMIDAIHRGQVIRAAVRVRGRPDAAALEEKLKRRAPTIPRWLVTGDRAWRHIPRFLPKLREEDVRRLSQSDDDFEFLHGLALRSAITVPMAARSRNLGAMTMLTAWSGRRYEQSDLRFAEILASRVALALDNAGLFSDLESVERRMDAVMSNLSEVVLVHDAASEMVFANPAAARFLGYASADELLAAPREEVLSRYLVLDEEGLPLPEREVITARMRRGELPWHQVLRIVFPSSGEERWAIFHSVPIAGTEGEPLYAVTTIEDVTEVKQAEFAQSLLARAGELFASSIDYRKTLQSVADLAVPKFADWCAVSLVGEEDVPETVAVAHHDPERAQLAREILASHPVLAGEEGIGRVLRTREPLLIQDTESLLARTVRDDRDLERLRRVGVDSVMIVPMLAGSKVLGTLLFADSKDTGPFNENDFGLATEIARRAGVAVENARLATEQAEVATVLQHGLRPTELPSLPGWEWATMYRPAGEVNEVGGDFYDGFPFAGGWMIVVGDVVGRGAAAASLTALARYVIRTAGALTGDPEVALRMLDKSLKEREDIALCTVALVVIPEAGEEPATVTVYSAGHPLPLLVRGQTVEAVGRPGSMPGAIQDPEWPGERIAVAAGDQLVLYTDGVVEARGERDRFGEGRLRERLAGAPDPAGVVARIEGALDRFIDGPAEDDAAAVVIKRVGVAVAEDLPAPAVATATG